MSLVGILLITSVVALASDPLAMTRLEIVASHPDSDNFSYIELSCVYGMSGIVHSQSQVIGAKFLLNGTDIKEEIDEVRDFSDSNGTVQFILTQEKEGFFTCSLNGYLSKNSIGLAGI